MAKAKRVSVEEQLAMYRKKKKREEDGAALKQKMWDFVSAAIPVWGRPQDAAPASTPDPGAGGDTGEMTEERSSHSSKCVKRHRRPGSMTENSDLPEQEEMVPPRYTTLDWIMLFLKVVLWLLLQKVFILLEFGAVFFICSAFVFIWYNLRNEPKKKGEASAYSVFNPECEAIDGTFTAEQFERELLHKM